MAKFPGVRPAVDSFEFKVIPIAQHDDGPRHWQRCATLRAAPQTSSHLGNRGAGLIDEHHIALGIEIGLACQKGLTVGFSTARGFDVHGRIEAQAA